MSAVVTVVIPTTMGGPYVRQAVESVRAQTFDQWEIKIVCDGCDDDLSDLKSDSRIEVIHQKRSGVSVARNTGFAASSGQWVTFLDHDDLMFRTKLESQLRAFENDPTVGLCHTQFEQVDMEGNLLEVGHGADVQYEDVLQCNYSMVISTAMFSREAFASAEGFDPKSQAEDIDLVLKVSRSYRLAFLPVVLLQYRRHNRNVSGDPWVQYREVDYVLRGYRRYLEGIGEQDSIALVDQGRINNRRTNAEIAMLRARRSSRTSLPGLGAVAKNLLIAARLSPSAIRSNAQGFVRARR